MGEVLAPGFFDEVWFRIQRMRFRPELTEQHASRAVELLGLRPGDHVLDVPVGTGRVALPLARRGMRMAGVDLYDAVLADARAAFDEAGLPLEAVQADMRDLPWTEHFDAVVNLWGSFGYFGDEGDLAFAVAAREALVRGGRFLIEGPGLEALATVWQRSRAARVGDTLLFEESDYDPVSGHVTSRWTFVDEGETHVRHWRVRVYSGPEIVRLLRTAGFTDVSLYGELDGRSYSIGSPRMVVVATR
jgi:SAM-dependent methyltransferase